MSQAQLHRGSAYHGHGLGEPIGLEYIAASLAASGLTPYWSSRNHLAVSELRDGRCISLFSGFTHEWPAVVRAARKAKRKGDTTIVGGYHACGLVWNSPDDAFDYVVAGEGEEVVGELLEKGAADRTPTGDSVAVKDGPRVVQSRRIVNVDSLALPARSIERLQGYGLNDVMWPPASCQRNVALVLASRGCANSCNFCASAAVWGQGVRLRSPESVVTELREITARFGTNTVVFIDQSLGQAARWTLDLCHAIQSANLGVHWYHQSNLTIDRGVLHAMADAGCRKIGFGLEGLSPLAIERIKPHNPHDFDDVNGLLDYCNSLGLLTKVYLMIGFPWETEDIVKEYFRWLPRLRANQIKISYFTPFPGTRSWDCYSNQLTTHDWADFDTVRMPVVHNPHVTVDQYHQVRTDLFQAFYGSPVYEDVTHRLLDRFPQYHLSYREFAGYLHAFQMITGRERWLDWVGYGKAPMSDSTAAAQG